MEEEGCGVEGTVSAWGNGKGMSGEDGTKADQE